MNFGLLGRVEPYGLAGLSVAARNYVGGCLLTWKSDAAGLPYL